ncbi:hypothetical protein QEN19_000656 [Hanseniaspora menglaensis]
MIRQNNNNGDCALISSLNLLKNIHSLRIPLYYNEEKNPLLRLFKYPFDKQVNLMYDRGNSLLAQNTLFSEDFEDMTVERIILSNNFPIKNIPNMIYSFTKYPYMIINLNMIKYDIVQDVKRFNYFINSFLLPEMNNDGNSMLKIFACGTKNHDLAIKTFNNSIIEIIDPLNPDRPIIYKSTDFLQFLTDYEYFYISFCFLNDQRLHQKHIDFVNNDLFLPKVYHITSKFLQNVVYLIWKNEISYIKMLKNESFELLFDKIDTKILYNNTNLDCLTITNTKSMYVALNLFVNGSAYLADGRLSLISDKEVEINEVKPQEIEASSISDKTLSFTINFKDLKVDMVMVKLCCLNLALEDESSPTFIITEYLNKQVTRKYSVNELHFTIKHAESKTL